MQDPLVRFSRLYIKHKAAPPTVTGLLLKPAHLPALVVICVLGTVALAALGLPAAWPCLFVGICIGAAARDLGIVVKTVKYWPVQTELMDWPKIEEVASRGDAT